MAFCSFVFEILFLVCLLKDTLGIEPVAYWSMNRVNKSTISSDIPNDSLVWVANNDFDLSTTKSPVGEALCVNRQIALSQLTVDGCAVEPGSCRDDGMTLTFWLKVNSWKTNNYQVILRTTTNTGYRPGIYIGDKDNKGVLQFNIRTLDGHYFEAEISREFVTHRWTHVALTWSFVAGVKVYVNCSEHGYDKNPSHHVVESFDESINEQFILGDNKMESDFDIDEIQLFQANLTVEEIRKQSFDVVNVPVHSIGSNSKELVIYLTTAVVITCLIMAILGRFLKRKRERKQRKFKLGRWVSNDGLDECDADITNMQF